AGVFTSASPWSWLAGRFGSYTGDAGDDVAGNHGFGWNLGNRAGYTFFSEVAAALNPSVPGTYTLGGIYDTGGPEQFGDAADRLDHYDLYFMVDQALAVDVHNDPVVGVFARVSGAP